jgi:hypothetical protein
VDGGNEAGGQDEMSFITVQLAVPKAGPAGQGLAWVFARKVGDVVSSQ